MSDTPTQQPSEDEQSADNSAGASAPDSQEAVDLIREKVARLYSAEPDAAKELAESENARPRSKHQMFMYELSTSGKDLAAIQTEWHNYYQALSDDEKHQVWQEFYASQPLLNKPPAATPEQALAEHKQQVVSGGEVKAKARRPRKQDDRDSKQIKEAIRQKVSAGGRLKPKHHLQSLLFGLGTGAVVVFIFLFGFFNQVIIAPFIQPSRAHADTPIIVGTGGVAPTSTPEVIIPKINVEIPVNYNETSTNEADIENDLMDGVVHYPTTSLPGQNGNTAFFGHSSNNIFNQGKYKFAFVLLHTLVNGDTFYLTYNDKVYIYKVISHTIVDPSDVGVLGPVPGQTATATLITCDPPGTSLHRLIVVGQQISPDPASNTAAASAASNTPSSPVTTLPSDGPSLWSRFINSAGGKLAIVAIVLIILTVGALRLRRWRALSPV